MTSQGPVVNGILAIYTGDIWQHKYKIRWDCYPPPPDTWEVRGNLHPEVIKEFEKENGRYVEGWPHRCDVCDLPCRSARGIAIHKAHAHKNKIGEIYENDG